ncbi:hypothetical protein EW026_g6481 [Hermanssonia centrifuga]|uniref:AAA+ ATPase domain-containing protein n=1 Tax=Hermanssonia centrifuga TaxID=98765 RepID=A0A4S4KB71_9APHY|nr:hypothetical protein EW026_g6481 [Hermanssonia centrifuga]
MRRYLSISKRSSTAPMPSQLSEKEPGHGSESSACGAEDNASTTALMTPPVPLSPPNLKVKRVDYYYSRWSKSWKYKNMGDRVTPEAAPIGVTTAGNDPWQTFCFVVVRKLPRKDEEPTFQVVIKSPYLLQACKDVIQKIPGISWNAEPLQLDPSLLIAFLPHFGEYQAELKKKKQRSQEESYILSSVEVLVEYLRKDYKSTIAQIENLTSHGEITFDLLHTVMVPRSTLATVCPITGEPRALHLVSATKIVTQCGALYDLLCESIDAIDNANTDGWGSDNSTEAEVRKAGGGLQFGKVQNRVIIPEFGGTIDINTLDAYPIKYHPNEAELRKTLLARGQKWVSLKGVHHVQYNGTGAHCLSSGKKPIKYNVNSRVMIDRACFRRLNPNYQFPVIKQEVPEASHDYDPSIHSVDPNRGIPTLRVQMKVAEEEEETALTEDELILAPAILYGFSLADKMWLEFNVDKISPIAWNDEAFHNLVLPPGRKTLLQSLVEAHNADLGFDDFVKGKGHGLVINLFGPPGVGKTLSAEATSEHVRRPLYVIGGGDLGTNAGELDVTLQRVFDIATSWKAIVLIDEADVFLEQRSLHDLERNAMVAVFLRHVEYYRGILFLTTNRVKTFDEAFLSRIHVALHFQELSKSAKMQVWRAFLQKVGVQVGQNNGLSESHLEMLADRNINGRQIKNATRTANSLAVSRREPLAFGHLLETLDAMDEFTAEFHAMTVRN